jgi:hypothetical protein
VENEPPYAEDPWEDDWDWEWPEEPAVTYRDAVDQLRSLVQARADVRIEWNGLRGLPRDEARVVFTGAASTGELRVRFPCCGRLPVGLAQSWSICLMSASSAETSLGTPGRRSGQPGGASTSQSGRAL